MNMTYISISECFKELHGTSFFGHTIMASANELTELFGIEPNEFENGKTHYEWCITIEDKNDNVDVYIYDYKSWPGDEYDVVEFHIGAKDFDESQIASNMINKIKLL